jgi:competence protein ComGC
MSRSKRPLLANVKDSGETLIEVMLAIAVLAVIVIVSLSTMNLASQNMQNSSERTRVRSDIDSQAEALRWIRDNRPLSFNNAGNSTWQMILGLARQSGNTDTAAEQCQFKPGNSGPRSFYISLKKNASGELSPTIVANLSTDNGPQLTATNVVNPSSFATVGRGVWIDAVRSDNNTSGQQAYVDFYIKACWTPLGKGADKSQTLTVVRIDQ